MSTPSTFYAFPDCGTVYSFYLKENVRDGISGWKIILTLMWYSFLLGIDQVMSQKQKLMALKTLLRKFTQNWVKYHWQIYDKYVLKDNDLRKLPPSTRALEQLTRGAYYQAGYVWQESVSDLVPPEPVIIRSLIYFNSYKIIIFIEILIQFPLRFVIIHSVWKIKSNSINEFITDVNFLSKT